MCASCITFCVCLLLLVTKSAQSDYHYLLPRSLGHTQRRITPGRTPLDE
jgi:hypothetical protein